MKNIKEIRFPNTTTEENQTCYKVGFSGVSEIIPIMKNGEMAGIQWFQVVQDGKIIAEIKESVCNVFGEDGLPDKTNIPF